MEMKVWIFLTFLLSLVRSQTIDEVKSLRTYLFTTKDYDSNIRPIQNQSMPIDVTVSFVLKNVNGLDEVEETLTTTGYLILTWSDDQLVWDPSFFGNTNILTWPQSQIWTPEIAVKNSFGNFKKLGYDELNAKILHYGLVVWYPHEVFVTTCTFDVRFFPFDKQVCEIQLTAWSYITSEMTFNNRSSLGMTSYQENPSWSIESTSINFQTDSHEPQINYVISLKRKASYTVVSVILPVCLLAVLNLFVFSLPASSGEKVGYAITVFLSLVVFLTIIESSMPKNSQTIPLMSLYMMLLVFQSTVITVVAIFLVKMLTNDDLGKPVPTAMVKMTQLMEGKSRRRQVPNNKVAEFTKSNDDSLKASNDTVDVDPEDQEDVTWTRVVTVLDKLCLWLFTFSFVLLTIVFAILIMV